MSTPGLEPSPELKARVLASIRAQPSSTRTSVRWSTLLVLLGTAALACGLYALLGGAPHGAGRSPSAFAASMSVWIVAAGIALWVAVGRGRAPEGRPRPALLAVACGLPLAIMATMLALFAASSGHGAPPILRPSSSCFALTLAAAAPGLLGLVLARRGSDFVHPAINGAALGCAFGTYAGVMVCRWCPDVSAAHLATGHVAPVVVLALLGAVLGRRWLDRLF